MGMEICSGAGGNFASSLRCVPGIVLVWPLQADSILLTACDNDKVSFVETQTLNSSQKCQQCWYC